MHIKAIQLDKLSLKQYCDLFIVCFPRSTKFTEQFLTWLYIDNPDGFALGFNAFDGDQLVAHYACIPATIMLNGTLQRCLLSLNTATHPSYQGRGLFTKLANLTYESGFNQGFAAVFGVANANSTPGFTKKLGFQLVAPLQTKIGWGDLNPTWENIHKNTSFQRIWSSSSFLWRTRNPSNHISVSKNGTIYSFWASTYLPFVQAYGVFESKIDLSSAFYSVKKKTANLFVGFFPQKTCNYKRYIDIPSFLKPSPLNFIFKDLMNMGGCIIEPSSTILNFADFDVF